MADRRMLSKEIILSDSFMDMPAEAQILYVFLSVGFADDFGFIGNLRQVMRMCGASDDSMKILIMKKFVLTFSKGDNFIVLIKHWRMHNFIRKDRIKESRFKELLRDVYYDENEAYSLNPDDGHIPCLQSDNQLTTNCQPIDNQLTTNCRPNVGIGKDRLGKDKLGKDSIGKIREDEINNIPIYLSEEKNEKNSQSSIEWERLARFYYKIGDFERAQHYVACAKAEGIEIELEGLTNG